FAWYFLGHTQHGFLSLIQVADVAGAYAISVLVAAVNGLLFELLCRWPRFQSFARLPALPARRVGLAFQAAVVAVLIAAALGYGQWQLSENTMTDGPRIALLQCSVDQATRNSRTESKSASELMFQRMEELTQQAKEFQPRADLMIWPETTYPSNWLEIHPS